MNMTCVICPYLKGGKDDAFCNILNSPVKDMDEFTIRLCMSRRYEACAVYKMSLHSNIDCGTCKG